MSHSLTKTEKMMLYGKFTLKENMFGQYSKKQVDQVMEELISEIHKLEQENQRLARELENSARR